MTRKEEQLEGAVLFCMGGLYKSSARRLLRRADALACTIAVKIGAGII